MKSSALLPSYFALGLLLFACKPEQHLASTTDTSVEIAQGANSSTKQTHTPTNSETGRTAPLSSSGISYENVQEIRFMAYNVENYLVTTRYVDGQPHLTSKPEEEIVALVNAVVDAKPEILGLCEIGTTKDLKDLQTRLRRAGLHLPHHYLTGGDDPTRHLALLSKFPITPHAISDPLEYPINDTVMKMSRGILDATVTIGDNYSLRLLGVHLKSKREVPDMDQVEMRKNEALLLRRYTTAILKKHPNINLLVYGDLNDTKNNSPIQIVRGAGIDEGHLDDLYLRDDRGTTWTHHWQYADIYSRFDYVLISRGVRPEINFDASYIPASPDVFKASDHRPLVVTLKPADR